MKSNTVAQSVAALPEVYQTIFGHPELSSHARRACEDRLTHIVQIYKLLEAELKRPLRVLDLGCAQGFFSFKLAELGAEVLGVDYQQSNIALCNALATEHPEYKVRFQTGYVEEAIVRIAEDQYDLVLGLSVFHHTVVRVGIASVQKMLTTLAGKVSTGVFEMALPNEPVSWARAQPKNPRRLLDGFAFVHEMARNPTHLSGIARPLYVASNTYWFLNRQIGTFDAWKSESHVFANGASGGTRRYYFGDGQIIKILDLTVKAHHGPNLCEAQNEIALLQKPPDGFKVPKLFFHGMHEHEAWLSRELVPGELLVDLIRAKKPYDAFAILTDVLKQLTVLEAAGLYHNDVRTWNILIGADGHAALLDYGAIGTKKEDCVWPGNIFLSFVIFMQEVVGGLAKAPDPLRPPLFNPDTLPEPYRSILWEFMKQSPETWRFAFLRDRLLQAERKTADSAPQKTGVGMALQVMEEACGVYRSVFTRKQPEALNSLGVAYCEQKKFSAAINCFKAALAINPALPEIYNNLAVVYFSLGDFSEAARQCEEAVRLRPDYAEAHTNLGNTLKSQQKWADAAACYERAISIKPDLIEARNNLGLACMELQMLEGSTDFKKAESYFAQILEQQPNYLPALNHMGVLLCHQGKLEEGIAYYRKALALQPDYREAINNFGNAQKALGQLNEAIASFRHVVALRPQEPEGHNNLAMALLLAGQLEEGWREYEWRWKTPQLAPAWRLFPQPQWRGEDAKGRTLLVYAEQGFGDTIQFCRYAPLLAARGIKVVLEVPASLVRLMQSLPGIEKIVSAGDPLPDFDLHCSMLSLPAAFGTRTETIPAGSPYLAVDKTMLSAWKKHFPADDKSFKVGLVWAGNPRLFSPELAAANVRRSLPPALLAVLANIPNVRLYSLQKDGLKAPAEFGLVDLMPEAHDFADTAALISHLDLVISVDTSVAHLAAALGKPVWLLNRFDSCWRWFLNREDSPWYSTMRIFRQPKAGDWVSVINKVDEELRKEAKQGRF